MQHLGHLPQVVDKQAALGVVLDVHEVADQFGHHTVEQALVPGEVLAEGFVPGGGEWTKCSGVVVVVMVVVVVCLVSVVVMVLVVLAVVVVVVVVLVVVVVCLVVVDDYLVSKSLSRSSSSNRTRSPNCPMPSPPLPTGQADWAMPDVWSMTGLCRLYSSIRVGSFQFPVWM